MRFSQRIGKRPIKTVLQVEAIDIDLKNRLWNLILEQFFSRISDYSSQDTESEKGEVCKIIWKEFYNKPIDKISHYNQSDRVFTPGFIEYVRNWFFKAEWYDIYDLIEFLAGFDRFFVLNFMAECNLALEKEVAGYRILKRRIVQITSEEEIQEIEDAISSTDKWTSVNTHLMAALNLLADRKSPDYRNSIKESISAIESLCIIITGEKNTTLGKAVNEIEKKHALHGALKTAFSSIYGYTSDSSGIRHALIEKDSVAKFEDAKFMLVSCSAFINYLKSKMEI